MSNRNILITIIFVIAIAALTFAVLVPKEPKLTDPNIVSPVTKPEFNQSIADGVVKITFPGSKFGLATNEAQVLVTSYIPPCDPEFNYCLYFTGTEYKGTNFESAGLRVTKRQMLTTEATCLSTPPQGFAASVKPNATTTTATHSSSIFAGIGNAGAGHYSKGSLYRLYVKENKSCYEFETRIGESQFQNYPEGSIEEFSIADRSDIEMLLKDIVDRIALPGDVSELFPQP
ncbi:MAG: hypothetical protein WC761_02655 [Candidatus Paceibacterota bacterium]|jgi:hypothetical protein